MKPITYSAESQTIVDAFEKLASDQQTSAHWSDRTVDPVRAEIKDHYISEQKLHCVYCKRQIVTTNKALWDAEHIICRDIVPSFMFIPQNLAVSCRDCNISKGKKEVRKTKRKLFPDESRHYLIVHPHFDNYSDHIRWIGDICVALSKKGVATQAICDLTRFTAKLLGINGTLMDPGFDKYVGELLKAKTRTDAKAAMAAISVYVENIPQE